MKLFLSVQILSVMCNMDILSFLGGPIAVKHFNSINCSMFSLHRIGNFFLVYDLVSSGWNIASLNLLKIRKDNIMRILLGNCQVF